MARLKAEGPNADQIEFWNSPAGDKWTAFMEAQDRMLGSLGELAMAAADIAPGQRIIDIGCGCGTTTLELARRTGPSGHVLGIDISTPMLERAQQRAAAAGPALPVALENRDAASYGFEAKSFDRVFSRFGVMFFADPVAAFSNIRQALTPAGRIAFVCWQPLELNPWMGIPIQVASQYVERPEPPGPDAPGPFAFRDPARIESILAGAGFTDIGITGNQLALEFEADIAGTVSKLLQLGPMAQPVAQASNDTQERIAQDLADAIARYQGSDGVRIDSASWIVSAGNA